MASTKFLIDTNAVIDYLGETLPEHGLTFMDTVIDEGYYISVINRIELFSYSKLTHKDIAALVVFVENSTMINISDDIVEKTIEIRQKYKTKLPDAIIAATAIVNNLHLLSRNSKDFGNINELTMLDPYSLSS
jgi:predicted nucleic acid-binding protein